MSASVSRPIRTMVSVSLALLFAGQGIAVAQRIEVEGRAWIPEISARAKIEGGSSSPGTPIDLGRDLGIDTEPLPELRLSIFSASPTRTAGGTAMRSSGRASSSTARSFLPAPVSSPISTCTMPGWAGSGSRG